MPLDGLGCSRPRGASQGWGASLPESPRTLWASQRSRISSPNLKPLQIRSRTPSWGISYMGPRTKPSHHSRLAAGVQWPQAPGLWPGPGTRELTSVAGFSQKGNICLCLHTHPEQPRKVPRTPRGGTCSERPVGWGASSLRLPAWAL